MKSFRFNDLPEAVRTRLVAASREEAPKPFLAAHTPIEATGLGLAPVVVCAIGLILASTSPGIPGLGMMLWLAASLALLLGGIARMFRLRLSRNRVPYVPGSYLFAADFVELTAKGQVIVTSTARLEKIAPLKTPPELGLAICFVALDFADGRTAAFMCENNDEASAAVTRFTETRASLRSQVPYRDAIAVEEFARVPEQLDPFASVRDQNNWDQDRDTKMPTAGPNVRDFPMYANIVVSGGLGLVLGLGSWYMLRERRDHEAFDRAQFENTSDSYETYLRAGGRYHRQSAQKALITAELTEAKRSGSVNQLRSLLRRYPNESKTVGAQASQAIRDLFQENLVNFEKRASTENPEVVPFMKRLLAHLEDTETSIIAVRFDEPDYAALQETDARLAEMGREKLGVSVAPVAEHFDKALSTMRATAITESLSQGFAQVFPHEILGLELQGEAGSRGDQPRIDIKYDVAATGSMYASASADATAEMFGEESRPTAYVGIVFTFDITMTIPDGGEPLHFKLKVTPPSEFSVEYQSFGYSVPGITGGPDTGTVYTTMASRAFGRLAGGLEARFFRPRTDADIFPTLADVGDRDLSALYISKGRDLTGESFRTTVFVNRLEGRVYELAWTGGPIEDRTGIAIWNPPYLHVAWNGGLSVFQTSPDDGRLRGAWTSETSAGLLGYIGGAKPEIGRDDSYTLTSVQPGNVEIDQVVFSMPSIKGATYRRGMWWDSEHTDLDSKAITMSAGSGFLTTAFGEGNVGVATYEWDGQQFKGTWHSIGDEGTGKETLSMSLGDIELDSRKGPE